jgi:HTH-type transcriptional regulator/antitoxin HigA
VDRLSHIRSEADLDRAIEEVHSLILRGDAISSSESKRMKSLTALIRDYESVHHPIPEPSQASMLRHLIDAANVTLKQLASATEIPQSTLTAILAGRRVLNRKQGEVLAQHFHVDPSVFEPLKPARSKSAMSKSAARLLAGVGTTTIHVGFPSPSVVSCTCPFQAMGTAAATTLIASTAVIYTPNGQLIGTLDAHPPPPFTWSYTFTDPLPQGVPLSLLVTGTIGSGDQELVVVPFQSQ